jgi:hypothetical protein
MHTGKKKHQDQEKKKKNTAQHNTVQITGKVRQKNNK